jgi:hypothetical protein
MAVVGDFGCFRGRPRGRRAIAPLPFNADGSAESPSSLGLLIFGSIASSSSSSSTLGTTSSPDGERGDLVPLPFMYRTLNSKVVLGDSLDDALDPGEVLILIR